MMKLKLFLILTMISVMGGMLAVWAQAQGTDALVVLSAPVDQVQAGDTVTVTIQVQDVVGAYGGRIKLSYDPSRFEVLSTDDAAVSAGDLFSGQPGITLKNTFDPAAGLVDYALTLRRPAEPVTGSGVLGTVNFRALADGVADFNLADAHLLSPRFEEVNGQKIASQIDEIPLQVQPLSLTVGGDAVEPIAQPPAVQIAPTMLPQPAQPVVVENPTLNPVSRTASPSLSPALVAGIVFFVLGLVMLIFSMMSYTRLRQNFRLVY